MNDSQAEPRQYRVIVDGREVYSGEWITQAYREAMSCLDKNDGHSAVIEQLVCGQWQRKTIIGLPTRPPGEIMIVLDKADLSRLLAGKEARCANSGREVRVILEDIGLAAIRSLLEALPSDQAKSETGCCGGRCQQAAGGKQETDYQPQGKIGTPILQHEEAAQVREVWDPEKETYILEEESNRAIYDQGDQEESQGQENDDIQARGQEEGHRQGPVYPG